MRGMPRESDINLVCGNCRDRTQMYEKVGKSWMLAQRNADYGKLPPSTIGGIRRT